MPLPKWQSAVPGNRDSVDDPDVGLQDGAWQLELRGKVTFAGLFTMFSYDGRNNPRAAEGGERARRRVDPDARRHPERR
mgnify:CR=1 FL=1